MWHLSLAAEHKAALGKTVCLRTNDPLRSGKDPGHRRCKLPFRRGSDENELPPLFDANSGKDKPGVD